MQYWNVRQVDANGRWVISVGNPFSSDYREVSNLSLNQAKKLTTIIAMIEQHAVNELKREIRKLIDKKGKNSHGN